MAEDTTNNTFLNADYMYEDVEGEAGKKLNLLPDRLLRLFRVCQSFMAQLRVDTLNDMWEKPIIT